MNLHYKLKQLGKRRPILEKQPIELPGLGHGPTLRQLIEAVVAQQVAAYNAKTLEKPLFSYLTESQIADGLQAGKVGFSAIYHPDKADLAKALQTAIEAHVDGLFAVAVNDKVVDDLETAVNLDENTVLTFIKLTLLKG